MNPHLGKYTVGVGILIALISAPVYGQLAFKSNWYFTSAELLTTPVGIQEEVIPFVEDRQPASSGIELSLADLQDRAEALGTWLGEMGIADRSLAFLQTTPTHVEISPDASADSLETVNAETDEDTTDTAEISESILSLPICSGFYFSSQEQGQLYALAQEQWVTSVHDCVETLAVSQDFLWTQEDHVIAQIQTYGELETVAPVPAAFWQLLVQEHVYSVAIWVPHWNAPDEEMDVWVDGGLHEGPVLVQSDPVGGVQIFLDFKEPGVKEIFLDNLLHNEQQTFLVAADPSLPQGVVLGQKPESSDDLISIEVASHADPAQFLEYYDEAAGMFFETSGSAVLGNVFLPHFFRYFDRQSQKDHTFLWTQRGELKGGTFEIQEVLMALRANPESQQAYAWDTTADVLVIRSAPGQALPDLHQVEISESQKLTWKVLQETFGVESEKGTLQVYVSPPEGQYWLSGPEDTEHQRVWVIQGMDTFVGTD